MFKVCNWVAKIRVIQKRRVRRRFQFGVKFTDDARDSAHDNASERPLGVVRSGRHLCISFRCVCCVLCVNLAVILLLVLGTRKLCLALCLIYFVDQAKFDEENKFLGNTGLPASSLAGDRFFTGD